MRFEAGARIDFATPPCRRRTHNRRAQAARLSRHRAVQRSFTPVSGSLGANYEFVPGWRAGLSLSHSERAPAIDELFSNGPHGGSQQFLIGDPDLRLEKSNGVELSVHRTTGPCTFRAASITAASRTSSSRRRPARSEDGLPVYEYRQGKADYYGFELESDVKFGKALGIDWGGEFVTDAVRAKIKGFGNAPRDPAVPRARRR